jgi:hypothetical protein
MIKLHCLQRKDSCRNKSKGKILPLSLIHVESYYIRARCRQLVPKYLERSHKRKSLQQSKDCPETRIVHRPASPKLSLLLRQSGTMLACPSHCTAHATYTLSISFSLAHLNILCHTLAGQTAKSRNIIE